MKLTPEQAQAKKELLEKIGQARRGHHEQRINYFGVVNPEWAEIHKGCCRLFRGPNAIQQQMLTAWENPEYKVFSMTGANRIGKTTLGVVIAISTMAFQVGEEEVAVSVRL